MKKKPSTKTPQPRYLPIYEQDDADRRRKLDCRRYNTCLDIAIARDWPTFACDDCPAFARSNGEQQRHDVVQLLALLAEAGGVGEGYFDEEQDSDGSALEELIEHTERDAEQAEYRRAG
jgi:hypothetical protein